MDRYTCPSCGYKVFTEEPGSYQTCPVCRWQDDVSQLRFVDQTGVNSQSLIDAQKTRQINTEKIIPYEKDKDWSEFDAKTDKIEKLIPGHDHGLEYPKDLTKLYYWKLKK
jgi:hypothetical protein